MPRRPRIDRGGIIYHVINRRVGRATLFAHDADYAAFETVLAQAAERLPLVRLLAYCLMPNHWHLVLWPARDGDMSRYLQWLTVTHMRRWHEHRRSVGTGPVYQGRYRSFPIQRDEHFITVCRYVERNPLRCGLVRRAEKWRWGSAGDGAGRPRPWLTGRAEWPVPCPREWTRLLNEPQTDVELAEVRVSVNRGRPFGADTWRTRTAATLGLQSTLRDRGRPRIVRK